MSRDLSRKPAGWGDLLKAIESLEGRVAAEAGDADARYKLAVLLLEAHQWTRERRQLSRAHDVLKQAVKQQPNHAPSHAVLGFIYDYSGLRAAKHALACMREAHRLNPRDKIYEVYLITMLQESGKEKEALAALEAAAPRHKVDLKKLRRELTAVRFKTDAASLLMNGFIRARNFLKSRLGDEAERILNSLKPGRAQREAAAQHERCVQTSASSSEVSMSRASRSPSARFPCGHRGTAWATIIAAPLC